MHGGDDDEAGVGDDSSGAQRFRAHFADRGSFDGDSGARQVIDDLGALAKLNDVAVVLAQSRNAEAAGDVGVRGELARSAVNGQQGLRLERL